MVLSVPICLAQAYTYSITIIAAILLALLQQGFLHKQFQEGRLSGLWLQYFFPLSLHLNTHLQFQSMAQADSGASCNTHCVLSYFRKFLNLPLPLILYRYLRLTFTVYLFVILPNFDCSVSKVANNESQIRKS